MQLKEADKFLNQKSEIIVAFLISIILLVVLIMKVDLIFIYNNPQNNLGNLVLSVFGTLFGLLLTAYAILFGLIPALSTDTLETNAFKSVGFRFFLALIANLFILILGLIICFINPSYTNILIYIQLFLIILLMLLFLLLIIYLFLLFKIARNNAVKEKQG